MELVSAIVRILAISVALLACVNRDGVERAREEDVLLVFGGAIVWREVPGETVRLDAACVRSSQQIRFCIDGAWELRWVTVSARAGSAGTGVVAVSVLPFDDDPSWGDAGDLEPGGSSDIFQVFHWEKATAGDFAACTTLDVEFDLIEGDAASVD